MTLSPPMLSVDLVNWPAAVLRVSADGTVLASNGRLDERLGRAVTGRRMRDLLDHDSSLRKWERLREDPKAAATTWELIFCTEARVLDTGAYSVVPPDEGGGWWLVEHPVPPRLATLASEVSEVNAELAMAQRALVIERGKLAHALAEVERSNRALEEFAHAVSHDLKSPLRAIREHAEVLADEREASADERPRRLARIHELTDRMRAMIDGAIAYARAGRPSDRQETVDTGALMHEIVAYLAPRSDVTIDIAPGMPIIETERVPFEQVFRNLVSNAITHADAGAPRIEIHAREASGSWEFTVADNGGGVPAAMRDRIWRLFHTSRPGEGTGVGLALVKRLVESRQGSVEVTEAPGGGAAFHVRWPATPARVMGGGG